MDLLVDSLVGGKLNELRRSLGMPPAKRIFRQWLSPPLLLGLFPDWYGRPQADWPAHLQLTGFPLAEAGEAGTLSPTLTGFLNDGPPPVVFTFGTGMAHADRQFTLAMEICQAGGWRGIFLTRHRRHLPADLPPSIMAVDHAHFADLFPHCSAVVHHGGVGTTAAAMAAGVPQVVMPVCFDQEDNGRRLERLEIGICLTGRKQTSARLEEALHLLLRPRARLRSAEIRERLISADGVRLAADRIEDFAGFR